MIEAIQYLARLPGGTQPHLLGTNDNRVYVVKLRNNPQHRRILVNEMLASALLRYLGVSTPESALIRISPEFLAANGEVHVRLKKQRILAEPGLHYGSRYPGDPAHANVYNGVPDSILRQVANIEDFRAAMVVDKWMGNTDARQCIFYRARMRSDSGEDEGVRWVVSMVDHGHVFNGPHWEFRDSLCEGLYPRKAAYEGVRSLDDFEPWLTQVKYFPEEVIDNARNGIPPEWVEEDEEALKNVLDRLLQRRKRVADFILNATIGLKRLFPRWSTAGVYMPTSPEGYVTATAPPAITRFVPFLRVSQVTLGRIRLSPRLSLSPALERVQ